MKTVNKEHYTEMKKRADAILNQKAEGMAAREIMAHIYVDGLQDKTMEQGLVMADRALEAIVDFNRTYAEAVKQKDKAFEKLLEGILEGKSLTERCNILSALYAGARAANARMEGEDREVCDEILFEADEEPVTEDEATEELAQELKEKVLEAFQNTSILSRGMLRQADQVEELIAGQGISQMVVQIGEEEAEYEGILAMIAYVESKTADIKELPPDISIEETACIVAATIAQEQIIRRYTAGEIAMNAAVALLDILGFVLLLKLAAKLFVLGVSMATSLCGMIIAIPAVVFVGLAIMGVFGEAVKAWNGGARAAVNLTVSAVKLGAGQADDAMRKVGEFVNNTAAPAAADIIDEVKQLFKTIKSKYDQMTTIKF
ncbi:MAG: hypothetical protein HFI97_12705 [Lachnospiraceae bacterium]|jgi:hypothetical protein|nr:hypothetical protein [Lachnospiraceae bacterium]MCI9098054.1 hypothetical protein [Lachnospiraceae bacterium]MCI9204548.1 hypothetical protein [Lachnospiraceae bacterium]